MCKKIILFLAGIIFFSSFSLVYADVVVNEVQLSPTDQRFIELYNTGDSEVDLTNWYIQRKTATGSTFGSLASKTNFEGKIIGAHDFFVISRNPLDNSDVVLDSLTLTESNTIQIKNSNEEVVDKVGWGSSTECDNPCPSNPGEGQSIKKIGGSWTVGVPTPGVENEAEISPSPSPTPPSPAPDSGNTAGGNNNTNIGNTNSTGPSSKKIEEPKIKVKITSKTLSFAGVPLSFEGTAFGYSEEKLLYGRYVWNFGDGDSEEIKLSDAIKFTHTYLYEGEYKVNLEYHASYYGDTPDASDQMTIKIVKPDIIISNVGSESDFFVELSNNTAYDADISGWNLSSGEKSFTFPKNTILISKKKMAVSSDLTHFSFLDKAALKFTTPQGRTVFNYGASLSPAFPAGGLAPAVSLPVIEPTPEPIVSAEMDISKENKITEEIPAAIQMNSELENEIEKKLEASVISNDAVDERVSFSYLPALMGFIFVGGSAGAVYYIRQKRVASSSGDNFRILD
jgi:hypothetical protein